MSTSQDPSPKTTNPADLGFDPDAMRERYRVERDKRLRADGNAQYIEVVGEFAKYVDDPYIESKIEREPVTDEVDVVLVGGGFGGLQAAARMGLLLAAVKQRECRLG